MAFPVDPVVQIKDVVHSPYVIPGILPVAEVGPCNAKAALEQAAYCVINPPFFWDLYGRAAGTRYL